MEITKALWQLFYAILIFAAYALCMVFVAPFGFGLAAFASAWTSFREGAACPLLLLFLREYLWNCSPSGFGSL